MESNIKDHYNSDNLTQKIETALIKAKKKLSPIGLKELSPIDQLHTGGARATIDLFKKASLNSNALLLDAGCGIGGSSRLLAQQFNCRVIGVDLADQFINAANFLTRITGLENSVSFQQGSVLDLPFEDSTFDVVLCQHLLMNIENKSTVIKEFSRVLKQDGKLILHEITKGENDTLLYPVPWAGKASISFLESRDIIFAMLEKHGFKTRLSSDETLAAESWWEKVKAVSPRKTPLPEALSPGIIFGDNAKLFGKNMLANFKNNAICLVEAVLKKS
ncbi:class I SAM-dependent methyltransferase [Desulfobacula phenolica]|uniref:Ubiquinone/menaquinone biosynthesis C-methylase UbiE n=1 Tax=Desulfobacula phenolica TaxID=90732 RepID=A0A1H2FV54_9BACT|nr:class I SAM-dependent methyltransferase [Desulfobacula phenolica]SDU11206.1 Ubiquinone/menaquinone biosynthesis C-methylase UbiE [Desulfobacula phenolica]